MNYQRRQLVLESSKEAEACTLRALSGIPQKFHKASPKHWISSLLQLVTELKAANVSVFVSNYENGSWDSTKPLLQQLKQDLNIEHQITIDDKSHEEIITKARNNPSSKGWLGTFYGRELRRIPYLDDVRNEALKSLLYLGRAGTKFDRILYINDVVFSVRVLDLAPTCISDRFSK